MFKSITRLLVFVQVLSNLSTHACPIFSLHTSKYVCVCSICFYIVPSLVCFILFYTLARVCVEMSSIRTVPVVDGIESCNSLSVCGDYIYVSTKKQIARYLISSSTLAIPTVEEVGKRFAWTNSSCIAHMRGYDDSLFVQTVDGGVFFINQKFSECARIPSIGVFAVNIAGDVCVSTKSGLVLYSRDSRESSKFFEKNEIESFPLAEKLVWVGNWIVGASRECGYFCVSPTGDVSSYTTIMPNAGNPLIACIPSTNQILIRSTDGLGIFINIHSSEWEPPSPAMRSTITLSMHHTNIILSNYLLSCSPDGILNVCSLAVGEKPTQKITLPGHTIFSSSTDTQILPAVSQGVLYLLIPVPVEQQFEKLMKDPSKFDEAFDLIEKNRPDLLESYHCKVGWYFIEQKKLGIGFQHFSLMGGDKLDWEMLFAKHAQLVSECTPTTPTSSTVEEFNNAFSIFLQTQKKNIPKQFFRQTLLFQLGFLQNEQLVEFVRETSIPLEIVPSLALKNPQALALIYEKNGELLNAIDVLMNALPATDNLLIDCLFRHYKEIGAQFLQEILPKVFHCRGSSLAFLIGQIPDPKSLITKSLPIDVLHILVKSPNPEIRINAFKSLQSCGEEIEKIIAEFADPAAILPLLPSGMGKMICLGKLGRIREALLVDLTLAERFLEMENLQTHFLLLVAILFEAGKNEQALKLVYKHESSSIFSYAKLVEIIPADQELTSELVTLLKRLNGKLVSTDREMTVEENIASWQFLQTHAEWANSRQINPAIIDFDETNCQVCQQLIGHAASVGVMPNGNVMHISCFTQE